MEKIIILSLSSFLFTFIGLKFFKNYLTKNKILDIPNKRSSHINPTPKGGGWVIVSCILGIIFILDPYDKIPAIITILSLATLSWLNDLKNINAFIRLFFQIFSISIYFFYFYFSGFYDQNQLIHIFFLIFIFTWFINIFNFMDGIDGISSIMSISIFLGIIIAHILNNSEYFPIFEILIMFSCFAFLFWNWNPAKIFLGDVGSIILGFICALSLYWLFLEGNTWHWVISLPMYYILDTSLTIIKRLYKKKKIWLAHKEHYYQKAVISGMKHKEVVFLIILLQMLIILTCYKINNPYFVVILSFLGSLGLIIYFSSKDKKST
tara:strand:+ start:9136 stop:10101 length:966 start_codon:yes stop_codon:yes gene_type:complete